MHGYVIFPAIGDCCALAVLCLQDMSKLKGVIAVDDFPEEELNAIICFLCFISLYVAIIGYHQENMIEDNFVVSLLDSFLVEYESSISGFVPSLHWMSHDILRYYHQGLNQAFPMARILEYYQNGKDRKMICFHLGFVIRSGGIKMYSYHHGVNTEEETSAKSDNLESEDKLVFD